MKTTPDRAETNEIESRRQFLAGLTAQNLARATADLYSGLHKSALWLAMGSQDIRQRYRRSRVGPFWITLSMGVTVAALGILYGALFQQSLKEYLPYLAAGFVVWGLISGLLTDGAKAFVEAEGLIRQLAAPLSVYVYREVWGNFLIFAHNLVVYLVVIVIFQINPGWTAFLAIPGVLMLLIIGAAVGLLFGLISARFRDVPQILASIVQVMFFVTPILWKVEMLPERAILLDLNPFFHLLEIVRAPMLGVLPTWQNWGVAFGVAFVSWALALACYTAFRWRISYWV
jgi:ABC-2 type transport system permease protein/lipopolysaccharide transport system permease protein